MEKKMTNEPLTDEQIDNWRNLLSLSVGPYAFIMPKEEVQKLADKMQDQFNIPAK